MKYRIVPFPCKPWNLLGLSERLIVSHYENNYGGAVRRLNAIRGQLASLDPVSAPSSLLGALKREELVAMNSARLHELYFSCLGAVTEMPAALAGRLTRDFGSVEWWSEEFCTMGRSLGGGSGWILLTYSPAEGRMFNQIAVDHAQTLADGRPILALDMFEHAYHIDFGANANAYIDTFMRNVSWQFVSEMLDAALSSGSSSTPAPSKHSIAIEELATRLSANERVQLIDARPRYYFSKADHMMPGAVWRDPDRVQDWANTLASDEPMFVYCAYGHHVGKNVAAALRERGFDAKFIEGGLSAWVAIGGKKVPATAESTETRG